MKKRKLVLFIAASLDGYIATKEHDLNWLFDVEGKGDNGISKFYNTIDTVVIGRTTYDWIMDQGSDFPYQDKACYVFSRTYESESEFVTFLDKDIVAFTQDLKKRDGKNIWIMGGGELISHFINESLIDEIIVTIAPVLLGSGINLFRETDVQTNLHLIDINRYNQFVELRYEVKK